MARRHQKYDLLNIMLQAIIDDGWNYIYTRDPKFHPFQITIYKDTHTFNLRIYIWNLTHGGGRARPEDEYRIQITGVRQFEKHPSEKTLILGWWREGGVFAGFDYESHKGALGASPSIQIRREALAKAYQKGIASWKKSSNEIAIAFHPDYFIEYVNNLETLHGMAQSNEDLEVFESSVEDLDAVNDLDIDLSTEERKTAVVNMRRKIRDTSFKSRVLTSYGHQCAFCGIQLKLIDAAHIVPVQHNGTDTTNNGIALCALHHRAYDRRLVLFDEKYDIKINPREIRNLQRIDRAGGSEKFIADLRDIIILPPAIADRPHVEFIKQANLIRGG